MATILNILVAIIVIAFVSIVALIALISTIVLVATYASINKEIKHNRPMRQRGVTAWRKRSIMEKENK